ncbi:hypothetical protein [Arcticibacter eurypsychrophilus]|uniref:hypothetical protein n=1 Tax=Arcticibacter eurypsychrophilus TaxID=1434752 RepID=UPI00084D8FB9|nr:hypothetical protein [Arcticibacter eurypsychrophilus]
MDRQIEKAIVAALEQFENITGKSIAEFQDKVNSVFESEKGFMDKVADLDATFDDEPALENLREVFFDLLMVNFFSEDVHKLADDYLETPEWEEIEEATIDRGTELLNVLLYIQECEDEDIQPDLEDFLKEFLLVDEDEFQDEHRIYEEMISNQILMESSIEEISKVAATLPEDSELKDLFYPIMSFFFETNPEEDDVETVVIYSDDAEFDAPVYSLLIAFNEAD